MVQGMVNICSGRGGSRRGHSRTDGSFNVVMAKALTNQIAALSIIIIIVVKMIYNSVLKIMLS